MHFFSILSVENELNMREFWKICRDFDLIFGDECSVMAVVYLELARCFSYQDDCRESYYFENAKYHKIILLGHKNQELIENVQCTPTQFLEGQIFQDYLPKSSPLSLEGFHMQLLKMQGGIESWFHSTQLFLISKHIIIHDLITRKEVSNFKILNRISNLLAVLPTLFQIYLPSSFQ